MQVYNIQMNGKAVPRLSIASHLPPTRQKHQKNELQSILKWAAVIGEHPHLYHPPIHTSNHHYYRIQFVEVSDLEALLGKRKHYLQFTAIIYNRNVDSFIGTTYSSEMFEVEPRTSEKPACSCKKSIYFYTELENISLKVDVWRLESQKNSRGFENMSKRLYVGHFEIDLSDSRESGIIEKPLLTDEILRFYPISEQTSIKTEGNEEQGKKKSSRVVYCVINTHSLSHLHHFIPPNYIFDEHHSILGLKDRAIGAKGEIEMGDRSRLNFNVKMLSVPLAFVKYITEISEAKINSSYANPSSPNINIKQMRLNFEFHNGWKSICCQTILLKESMSQTGNIDTNRTSIPSKIQSKISKGKQPVSKNKLYTYDKSKQLKAVFMGEEGVLIMWIEAKIESKFDVVENGNKKAMSDSFYLPLAFALKTLPQFEEQTILKVQFACGNPYNLPNLMNYFMEIKNKKEGNEDSSDKLYCDVAFLLQKSGGTIENIQTVEKEMNDIENLKIEKERLLRLKRKIKEEKRKKLIELNQEIPFLDTTQLKEQLYEEKLAFIKNEKQEQEEILQFLKAKINQLERQAFKNELNYEEAEEDEDQGIKNTIKMKKMPEHFIDYRPEPASKSMSQSIALNYFSGQYCKLAQAPLQFSSAHLLQTCLQAQTFLQFKITGFEFYFEEMKTFKLLIPNFQGRMESLPFTSDQFENKSLQIKITLSKEKTNEMLNSLLNGFFQISLEWNDNERLQSVALVTLSELIAKCNDGDLLQSTSLNAQFTQDGVLIAYLSMTVAFTNTHNSLSVEPKDIQLDNPQRSPSKQCNILNRIQRFKLQKGERNPKSEAVDKIMENSKVNKISVYCRQFQSEKISLNISNSSSAKQQFIVYIFDEDAPFIENPELSILPNALLFLHSNSNKFQLQSSSSGQITLMYLSERVNINLNLIKNIEKSQLSAFYKHYNHQHKINVNIAKKQSNIIVERYQISITPAFEYNNLVIQQFLSQEKTFSLPIATSNLEVVSTEGNVERSATSLNLSVPQFTHEQLYLSQFLLRKQIGNYRVVFQKFQFYGWKCQNVETDARLWEKKDVLLKIPLELLLEKEMSLPYLIEQFLVFSRHINVKIRQSGQFSYYSQLNVNRKMGEIFIRAQVEFNQIGKHVFGVEIADKDQHIFHRIGISAKIEYPTIASHQIITIKVPTEQLDIPQPFEYQNKQQAGLDYSIRCNMPHLLKFKQSKIFLKRDQEWRIQMLFNWTRILNLMEEESKDEVCILIGIISGLAIDYFLFKCRES